MTKTKTKEKTTKEKTTKDSSKKKQTWKQSRYPRNPANYKEFIEISLSLGESLETIARRSGLTYNILWNYIQKENLHIKYKNRKWTHRDPKPRKKYTIAKTGKRQGELRVIPDG